MSDQALITLRPGMYLITQMNISNQLKIDHAPALFYEVIAGIDSSFKEAFTRVEERKFDMHDMQEKGKNNCYLDTVRASAAS
jgi:hypothetical protein